MYFVYIIKSIETGKLYTGFTKNLRQRYKQHLSKKVFSTKSMGTLKLIFFEGFLSKNDALRREKYLKTTKGKRALKLMIKNSIIST